MSAAVDQDRLKRVHEAANSETPAPTPPKWRRCRELVDAIMTRASEPWVPLVLDGGTLAEVRPGGIALLVGATGGGKTSLAASLLVEHAQRSGPALSVSLELTADEWTARAIGVRTGATWPAVLRGQVPAGQMLGALPERLAIIERDDVSIGAVEAAIDDLRREYPGEPVLVAVDYAQLVGADSEDEIRPRIGRVMRQLDRVARDRRVVLLALSQGSRASSRMLRSGDATGAQTTDAGAESADLERWSTVTLAIVGDAPADEDGWYRRGIALGKSRMGTGDSEAPARYHGPSGRWELVGEARPAADVRAEREAQREDARLAQLALAVRGAIESASAPLTDRQLGDLVRGTATARRAATRRLLGDPDSGIVRCGRASTGKHPRYPVWTRERALAAGLPIHDSDPGTSHECVECVGVRRECVATHRA